MGYYLKANNKGVEGFRFGAFSWGPLLQACGCLWPFMSSGGRWYCVWGADPRLGTDYPAIISNDGMEITEEEARIIARCARNLVLIQRSLPEENMDQSPIGSGKPITRDTLADTMIKTIRGIAINEEWPIKMRTDFVDKYESFADWAEKSGGFKIY